MAGSKMLRDGTWYMGIATERDTG